MDCTLLVCRLKDVSQSLLRLLRHNGDIDQEVRELQSQLASSESSAKAAAEDLHGRDEERKTIENEIHEIGANIEDLTQKREKLVNFYNI